MNAVKTLGSAVDIFGREPLKVVLDAYTSKSKSIEERVKIAECLMHVIRKAGDTYPVMGKP